MQPYFLPYIGYFQLIAAVDLFIIYDNVKYTKKGWINRNRILKNGKDVIFSLPLKSNSDCLDVYERVLAADYNREKLLNQLKGAYHRAPYFKQVFPLIEQIVQFKDENLFRYILNSIVKICEYLKITTRILISSEIAIDHELKGQDKVLALCKASGASTYLNAIGGMELYSKGTFLENGIELKFIRSIPFEYPQFANEFVPWLSIIDVMMFNAPEKIIEKVNGDYELV